MQLTSKDSLLRNLKEILHLISSCRTRRSLFLATRTTLISSPQ